MAHKKVVCALEFAYRQSEIDLEDTLAYYRDSAL